MWVSWGVDGGHLASRHVDPRCGALAGLILVPVRGVAAAVAAAAVEANLVLVGRELILGFAQRAEGRRDRCDFLDERVDVGRRGADVARTIAHAAGDTHRLGEGLEARHALDTARVGAVVNKHDAQRAALDDEAADVAPNGLQEDSACNVVAPDRAGSASAATRKVFI